jgi:hypothetical protein
MPHFKQRKCISMVKQHANISFLIVDTVGKAAGVSKGGASAVVAPLWSASFGTFLAETRKVQRIPKSKNLPSSI